jgi:hypothetical protein
MSMGGLFIETPQARAEGVQTRLHFLGLKFTALSEQDRPKLAALLTRLRGTYHSRGKS